MAMKQKRPRPQITLVDISLPVITRRSMSITVDVITWNVTGSRTEEHFAAIREGLVPIVRHSLSANTISCLQEISAGSKKTSTWGFSDLAVSSYTRKPEAGISTPQSPGELELGDILQELQLRDLQVPPQFAERMCGRSIKFKKVGKNGDEYTSNITMISYHAPYQRLPKDERKEKMVSYFQAMCCLADMLEQTIIIGGDFNLPVLDWKEDVERHCEERVTIAIYIATPRRWARDKLIDTFAIVQPRKREHKTAESKFQETMAIYPFPMAGHVGGAKSTLQDYPSPENKWFKYVRYSGEHESQVKEAVEEKARIDIRKIEGEIQMKKGELSKVKSGRVQTALQKEICELSNSREILKNMTSEPYTNIDQYAHSSFLPPAPLWPNSPLDNVLDHDPVMTRITVNLQKTSSTQHVASATPRRRSATSSAPKKLYEPSTTSRRRDDASSGSQAGTFTKSKR